jgi:hypothetical protein
LGLLVVSLAALPLVDLVPLALPLVKPPLPLLPLLVADVLPKRWPLLAPPER